MKFPILYKVHSLLILCCHLITAKYFYYNFGSVKIINIEGSENAIRGGE
jgi:hypothetical protein